MKRWVWALPLLNLGFAVSAPANPFQSSLVCVPKINPNQAPLEFQIRNSGSCAEGEKLMQVQTQGDGSVLLLPYQKPLEPEQQEVLKEFKRYHGIK